MAKKPTHIEAVMTTLSGKDVLGALKRTNKELGELRKFLAGGHRVASGISKKLSLGHPVTAAERAKFTKFLTELGNYIDEDWPGNGGPIAGH